MNQEPLTESSLFSILMDPEQRTNLIAQIESEEDTDLPVSNLYAEVGERCEASPEQIRQVVNKLLDSYGNEHDWLIEPFIFHPNIPDDVLSELYRRNAWTVALAHRKGPQDLLERLAEEHNVSEAIITLALDYYLGDQLQVNKLVEIVQKHKSNTMLRRNLLVSPKLDTKTREIILQIYQNK